MCIGRLWCSDLITLVRQVTPLCRFYMEKTHPTKVSYPDGLPGQAALVGYLNVHVKTMKKKNETVRIDWLPYQSRQPHLLEVPHFHVNRSLILGVTLVWTSILSSDGGRGEGGGRNIQKYPG